MDESPLLSHALTLCSEDSWCEIRRYLDYHARVHLSRVCRALWRMDAGKKAILPQELVWPFAVTISLLPLCRYYQGVVRFYASLALRGIPLPYLARWNRTGWPLTWEMSWKFAHTSPSSKHRVIYNVKMGMLRGSNEANRGDPIQCRIESIHEDDDDLPMAPELSAANPWLARLMGIEYDTQQCKEILFALTLPRSVSCPNYFCIKPDEPMEENVL